MLVPGTCGRPSGGKRALQPEDTPTKARVLAVVTPGQTGVPHRACGLPTQDVLLGRHVQATSADVWDCEVDGRGRLGPRRRRMEDEKRKDALCFLEFGLINASVSILLRQKHDLASKSLSSRRNQSRSRAEGETGAPGPVLSLAATCCTGSLGE